MVVSNQHTSWDHVFNDDYTDIIVLEISLPVHSRTCSNDSYGTKLHCDFCCNVTFCIDVSIVPFQCMMGPPVHVVLKVSFCINGLIVNFVIIV